MKLVNVLLHQEIAVESDLNQGNVIRVFVYVNDRNTAEVINEIESASGLKDCQYGFLCHTTRVIINDVTEVVSGTPRIE